MTSTVSIIGDTDPVFANGSIRVTSDLSESQDYIVVKAFSVDINVVTLTLNGEALSGLGSSLRSQYYSGLSGIHIEPVYGTLSEP